MTITRVSDSAIISAKPEDIWRTIRDFNNVARWHPDVADCQIEGDEPGDCVGAVRKIHLQDGSAIREQVTALSDKDMAYSYSVIESPLPLLHHSSTVSLIPVDGGKKTVATWYAEFALKDGDAVIVSAAIHKGVILAGFCGLVKLATESAQ